MDPIIINPLKRIDPEVNAASVSVSVSVYVLSTVAELEVSLLVVLVHEDFPSALKDNLKDLRPAW